MKNTAPKSKRSVKKHLQRLVKGWREANELSWSTVGRPGPCFTNSVPGPDKDSAWAGHHEFLEAIREEAAARCFEALAKAPAWLRGNRALLEKAFDKSFLAKDGCAAWGPDIPSLPDMRMAVDHCTFNGMSLPIETWSNRGPFVESSEGESYCSPDCKCSEEGRSHKFSTGIPAQGFCDDQGRLWSRSEHVRTDSSDSFGWWESTYRWYLRPEGSECCPTCGGDSWYKEHGFVCPCVPR